jgi:hypothetical protein
MKFLIGMVVLALGVYWGARQGYIQGQWLAKLTGVAPSADDDAVAQVVANTNQRLPRMVNDDVRFEKVMTVKKDVIFMYRFVNHDLPTIHQHMNLAKLRETVIRDMCESRDVRKHAFERGYGVQVYISSREYQRVQETTVQPSSCS